MKKRVYIVHGWDGSPKEPMYQWLRTELEKKGFVVSVPKMPHSENPTIEDWVSRLSKIINTLDRNVFLVGHSVGCQTILRYLEQLPVGSLVGGTVFIAPWFTVSNLEDDEARTIAEPWIKTPINDGEVMKHLLKLVAIFSDNDPFVPVENVEFFKRRLGAKTVVLKKKGHFTEDDVEAVPEILDAVLEVAGDK